MSNTTTYAMDTSGANASVWTHQEPYSNRPHFAPLEHDVECDVCIIGAGIAGISTAYELVTQGVNVVLIEAREVLSGETGRTSGLLSCSLDDGFTAIAKKHGDSGAKLAAEASLWAIKRVGEISSKLGIECDYRVVPDYEIAHHTRSEKVYNEEIAEIKKDVDKLQEYGLPVSFDPDFAIKGWDGAPDQRGAGIHREQAAFHPTKYLNGLLQWLAKQQNFHCYTHTRMSAIEEKSGMLGIGKTAVNVTTANKGNPTIKCANAVEATCIPLQKLSIVAQVEYFRTYCIAIRVPKGSVEDCLINTEADPYIYIRQTPADEKDSYLIVGGEDHKFGQTEDTDTFYLERCKKLEDWTRARFPQATSIDYAWSGQILNSTDMVHFIGRNQGKKHTWVVTGDSGHGLTQGVIASRLLADEIQGKENAWSSIFDPSRLPSPSTLLTLTGHSVQINSQFKELARTEINDIEDLQPGCGGVLNKPSHGEKPLAVYKDESGVVHKFTAICPHLGARVNWNQSEQSFDCPVHGSRFSKEGI